MKPYQPISCNFYDELEAFATRKQAVAIVYRDAGNMLQTHTGVIRTFTIENGAEWLHGYDGFVLRLDQIVSVGGKVLKGYC